jgi:hypothetical protein
MPVSNISQEPEACCCYKSSKRFPAENVGKLSVMNVNELFAISSNAAEAHGIG